MKSAPKSSRRMLEDKPETWSSFLPRNRIKTQPRAPRNDIATRQPQDDLETYQHLPLGDSEIRLLVVEPAAEEIDIVKATLRTVSFTRDATPGYNAVSYSWGCGFLSETILLRCASGDWKGFRVSETLYSLLQRLRRPDQPTNLWIDAICIDQKNNKEKESQLGQMAQVYRKADEVSIWLGEYADKRAPPMRRDPEASKVAFDFIAAVAEHRSEMVTQDHASGWQSFISLMKLSWFSRRWVIQELAFAQNPVMYCGRHKICWALFRGAMQVFTDHFDAILDITQELRRLKNLWIERTDPLEAIPLAAFKESAFEKDTHKPVFSLEALVASMAVFETSDPRDVVYALLSVAKDRLVEPDYTANVFQVYANFTEKVINASGSLDIICRRWAATEMTCILRPPRPKGTNLVRLPSWIRHTDGSMFEHKDKRVSSQRRCNSDPLVGMPGKSPYAACADSKAAIRMGGLRRLPASTDRGVSVNLLHTLYAKGVVIGTVSSTGPQGSAFIQSVNDSFRQDRSSATVPEKLWRTLVADRALDGGPAPDWYGDSCLRCLEIDDCKPSKLFSMDEENHERELFSLPPRFYPEDVLESWGLLPRFYPEDVLEFRKRVEAVVCNQSAFDGDTVDGNEEKLFGIGPVGLQAGDNVCILFGCSVPVILRRTEDVDGNECFRCLGESFVYNMMNGQALEGLSDDQVKEFAIV